MIVRYIFAIYPNIWEKYTLFFQRYIFTIYLLIKKYIFAIYFFNVKVYFYNILFYDFLYKKVYHFDIPF